MENNNDEEVSLWGFNQKGKNKKGMYINSKFRVNNLLNINLDDDVDTLIHIFKIFYRMGAELKSNEIKMIMSFIDVEKISKAKDKIVMSNFFEKPESFEKSINDLLSGNYNAFCSTSSIVLEGIKDSENKRTNLGIKRNSSYVIDDYIEIVSSSAFRRLQDKAQVYSLEERDFVRSRLTHSYEVSANCELIASYIDFAKCFYPDEYKKQNEIKKFAEDCIYTARCAGLLHDIGNPPFGHYGENIIKKFFKEKNIIEKELGEKYSDFVKFDGNAQALRIVTKLQYFGEKDNLALTSTSLGAIIKYPFSSNYNYIVDDEIKDKFSYFQSEENVIQMLECFGTYKEYIRNPLSLILEAADDISYLTADLEDAIHKGLVSYNGLISSLGNNDDHKVKEFKEKIEKIYQKELEKYKETYLNSNDEARIFECTMRPIIEKLRRELVISCAKKFVSDKKKIIDDGIDVRKEPNYDLVGELTEYKALIKIIKGFMKGIYKAKEINELEITGDRVLSLILNEYYDAIYSASVDFKKKEFKWDDNRGDYYKKIMSFISKDFMNSFFKSVDEKSSNRDVLYYKMHLLVDYVSGMTDSYAYDMYKLLSGM